MSIPTVIEEVKIQLEGGRGSGKSELEQQLIIYTYPVEIGNAVKVEDGEKPPIYMPVDANTKIAIKSKNPLYTYLKKYTNPKNQTAEIKQYIERLAKKWFEATKNNVKKGLIHPVSTQDFGLGGFIDYWVPFEFDQKDIELIVSSINESAAAYLGLKKGESLVSILSDEYKSKHEAIMKANPEEAKKNGTGIGCWVVNGKEFYFPTRRVLLTIDQPGHKTVQRTTVDLNTGKEIKGEEVDVSGVKYETLINCATHIILYNLANPDSLISSMQTLTKILESVNAATSKSIIPGKTRVSVALVGTYLDAISGKSPGEKAKYSAAEKVFKEKMRELSILVKNLPSVEVSLVAPIWADQEHGEYQSTLELGLFDGGELKSMKDMFVINPKCASDEDPKGVSSAKDIFTLAHAAYLINLAVQKKSALSAAAPSRAKTEDEIKAEEKRLEKLGSQNTKTL